MPLRIHEPPWTHSRCQQSRRGRSSTGCNLLPGLSFSRACWRLPIDPLRNPAITRTKKLGRQGKTLSRIEPVGHSPARAMRGRHGPGKDPIDRFERTSQTCGIGHNLAEPFCLVLFAQPIDASGRGVYQGRLVGQCGASYPPRSTENEPHAPPPWTPATLPSP